MGRRVFVSVLGIGRNGVYEPCKYGNRSEGFACETSYIQEATLRYLASKGPEWTPDKAIILLTDKARELSWGKLKPILAETEIPLDVEDVSITDGKDVSQIWDIFTILFDKLEEGDELFFDLTHGFRYLPMMVLTMSTYSRFLKKTVIRSITYGNYEGRDEAGLAPIVDLLPLADIQDWAFAAGEYTMTGSADHLTALCYDILVPRLRNRDDIDAKLLKSFAENLNRIVNERRTCRGLDVLRASSIQRFRNDLALVKKELIPAYAPIIDLVANDMKEFSGIQSARNNYLSAKWCSERGLYQQAITLLHEGMITKVCLDWNLNVLLDRDLVSGAFAAANRKNGEARGNDAPAFSDLSLRIAESIELKDANLFDRLRKLRNDVNHCGFRGEQGQDKPLKVDKVKEKVQNELKQAEAFFEEGCRMPTDASPVFINLSNHPFSTWSEEQLEAARKYGRLEDMAFPTIDAEWDKDDISRVAGDIVLAIRKLAPVPEATTVHVMGEMTMTYSLVETLMALGYRCLASTTERRSWIDQDGNKVTAFGFVRFREY